MHFNILSITVAIVKYSSSNSWVWNYYAERKYSTCFALIKIATCSGIMKHKNILILTCDTFWFLLFKKPKSTHLHSTLQCVLNMIMTTEVLTIKEITWPNICDPLPQNEAEVAALYFELWLIIDDLGRCGPICFFCIFFYSKTLSCMLLTHLFLSDIFNVQNGHFSQVSYI